MLTSSIDFADLAAVHGRLMIYSNSKQSKLKNGWDDSFEGKYTVPVLWDKKTKTIVNNESADIVRMFNDRFNGIAEKVGHPNL